MTDHSTVADDATLPSRLATIFALVVPMQLMDMTGTVLVAWSSWRPDRAAIIATWCILCAAVMASRLVMGIGFRSHRGNTWPAARWARLLVVGATVEGAAWGVLLAWLLPALSLDQASFVLCVALAGVTISIAHVVYWPLFATYAGPLLGGVALGFARSSRIDHSVLALGAVVTATGLLVITHRLSRQLLESYRLAAEKRALADDLTARGRSLEEALATLETISRTDALTGLANRRWRDEWLVAHWEMARASEDTVALIAIDVDRFKAFNDLLGHDEGDRCLCAVADAIRAEARAGVDFTARQGGEEFMLILPGLTGEEAVSVAERLRQRVADCWHATGLAQRVTISLGIACCRPCDGVTHEVLARAADAALYRAKLNGRNRHEVADARRAAA